MGNQIRQNLRLRCMSLAEMTLMYLSPLLSGKVMCNEWTSVQPTKPSSDIHFSLIARTKSQVSDERVKVLVPVQQRKTIRNGSVWR